MSDLVKLALEQFKDSVEYESDNRKCMDEDVRFSYLAEQWPAEIKRQRERDQRPVITVNRMPSFIRQVVNDARQNRPAIKVSGVDSQADPQTAEILNGLIRHIERNSDADVAYDTAIEWAVSGGLGYFTIGTEYADDNGFDQELTIDRVVNPFSVYADCDSEKSDSSDWRYAFQIVTMDRKVAEKQYKAKDIASWSDGGTGDVLAGDDDEDEVRLARYWKVTDEEKTLLMLSNGAPINEDELTPEVQQIIAAQGIYVVDGKTRKIAVPKVSLHILSADDELEDAAEWAGRYIPIVPVYGSEMWLDGKRVLRSLIHDGKDPQRMINFWKSASTELVALAPKAPWIGPKGFTKSSPAKWKNANIENHAFLEFDGEMPPQRQPFAGVPAGALQEALNASDDLKTVLGMYDASLGARSNETSGKAIMARQREGDVNSFHFADNLVRAIRHAGRILIDLIPKVYDSPRVVRILGVDGSARQVQLNAPTQEQDEDTGQMIERIYDVTTGRYDVAVSAGPSYTTQRQETAEQMTDLIRAFPAAAPVLGDLLVKNLDWNDADEAAKRLAKLSGQGDPQQSAQAVQQAMQQVQQGQQQIAQGQQEIEQGKQEISKLLSDLKVAQANLKTQEANLQAQSAQFQAEVATAKADLQGREVQVEMRGMQTDQRGQMLEAGAQQNGSQVAAQIVQEALQAVDKRIAGLEQSLGRQSQQPIIVPIPSSGGRRQVSVKRGKGGELMGMIEDMADDGIGNA